MRGLRKRMDRINGRRRKRNRGFSLVELICAVAIMSVLAATVGSAVVVSVNNYKRGTAEADVQSEAQLALSVITDLLLDATDATNKDKSAEGAAPSDKDLYIYGTEAKADGTLHDYWYHIYWDGSSELRYAYSEVANEGVLARNVVEFHADAENFRVTHNVKDLRLVIYDEVNDRAYSAASNTTSRNYKVTDTSEIQVTTVADPMIYLPEAVIVLEPNQTYEFKVNVIGAFESLTATSSSSNLRFGDSESDFDSLLTTATVNSGAVDSGTATFTVQAGTNAGAVGGDGSEYTISFVLKYKEGAEDKTIAAAQGLTARIRRVTAIEPGNQEAVCKKPVKVEGVDDYFAKGAVYEATVKAIGSNLDFGGYAAKYDTSVKYAYIDPRALEFGVVSSSGIAASSIKWEYDEDAQEWHVEFALSSDLAAGSTASLKIYSPHTRGGYEGGAIPAELTATNYSHFYNKASRLRLGAIPYDMDLVGEIHVTHKGGGGWLAMAEDGIARGARDENTIANVEPDIGHTYNPSFRSGDRDNGDGTYGDLLEEKAQDVNGIEWWGFFRFKDETTGSSWSPYFRAKDHMTSFRFDPSDLRFLLPNHEYTYEFYLVGLTGTNKTKVMWPYNEDWLNSSTFYSNDGTTRLNLSRGWSDADATTGMMCYSSGVTPLDDFRSTFYINTYRLGFDVKLYAKDGTLKSSDVYKFYGTQSSPYEITAGERIDLTINKKVNAGSNETTTSKLYVRVEKYNAAAGTWEVYRDFVNPSANNAPRIMDDVNFIYASDSAANTDIQNLHVDFCVKQSCSESGLFRLRFATYGDEYTNYFASNAKSRGLFDLSCIDPSNSEYGLMVMYLNVTGADAVPYKLVGNSTELATTNGNGWSESSPYTFDIRSLDKDNLRYIQFQTDSMENKGISKLDGTQYYVRENGAWTEVSAGDLGISYAEGGVMNFKKVSGMKYTDQEIKIHLAYTYSNTLYRYDQREGYNVFYLKITDNSANEPYQYGLGYWKDNVNQSVSSTSESNPLTVDWSSLSSDQLFNNKYYIRFHVSAMNEANGNATMAASKYYYRDGSGNWAEVSASDLNLGYENGGHIAFQKPSNAAYLNTVIKVHLGFNWNGTEYRTAEKEGVNTFYIRMSDGSGDTTEPQETPVDVKDVTFSLSATSASVYAGSSNQVCAVINGTNPAKASTQNYTIKLQAENEGSWQDISSSGTNGMSVWLSGTTIYVSTSSDVALGNYRVVIGLDNAYADPDSDPRTGNNVVTIAVEAVQVIENAAYSVEIDNTWYGGIGYNITNTSGGALTNATYEVKLPKQATSISVKDWGGFTGSGVLQSDGVTVLITNPATVGAGGKFYVGIEYTAAE